jgi:hypothetical protein
MAGTDVSDLKVELVDPYDSKILVAPSSGHGVMKKPRASEAFGVSRPLIPGGNFFFAPYYQNTKSKGKTGQKSLRI